MQIDWLSAYTQPRDPVYRKERIWTPARFLRISPDGEIKSETPTLTKVNGSHDASMSWGSRDGNRFYLTGNPVKFLQGHNLFGSPDALALWIAAGWRVRMHEGEFPSPEAWQRYELELPTFTRIDITRSYRFGNQREALKWIRRTASTAHTSYLKKSLGGTSTVYFGMSSRRWSLKIYAKLDELLARKKGHSIPATLGRRAVERLLEWADGVVRFELTLRRLELKELSPHLQRPQHLWQLQRLWQMYHDRIQYNRNAEASSMDDFPDDKLTPAEKVLLAAWRSGADLQDILPRSTWYMRRKSILEAVGVDIAEAAEVHETASADLDPEGWDPEPIDELMHDPEPEARRYPLKRAG